MGAKITVEGNYGLNMNELDFAAILYAESYVTKASIFRADYASGSADEFRGSFTFGVPGEPILGTITSYTAIRQGNKMFTVSGIVASAEELAEIAANSGNYDDKEFMARALSGNDVFNGGRGDDIVHLSAGNDIINGNAGNDTIFGDGGNDKITGGLGRDNLYGGSAGDMFIYKALSDSTRGSTGRDTINSLKSGDKVDLSALDANAKISGNQAFAFIGTGNFSGAAGELRYSHVGFEGYVYADVDGDRKSDFTIHFDMLFEMSKNLFIL